MLHLEDRSATFLSLTLSTLVWYGRDCRLYQAGRTPSEDSNGVSVEGIFQFRLSRVQKIPVTSGSSFLHKRRYIIFVSHGQDGALRKVPVPIHYAYIFLAVAAVGVITIAGLAGSYSRMLLKTARFDQVRRQKEVLRKDYLRMAAVAHEKDVQEASLGSLAGQISALYGLSGTTHKAIAAAGELTSTAGDADPNNRQYLESLNQFLVLRTSALSGATTRHLYLTEPFPLGLADVANTQNIPTLWPIQGRVTSSFGERTDPFFDEGSFHPGIDIAAQEGDPVHAAAAGIVIKASWGDGYGREVMINHGHGIETVYAHLSGFAVTVGERVVRGEVVGYVGSSGRSTGPHLHYEVRVHNIPVNPHQYLRMTMSEYASAKHNNATLGY